MLEDLLKQTSKRLYKDINQVGCFFRSSIAIAELKCEKALSAHDINKIWNLGEEKGFIVNRELVKGGAPITNLAFQLLSEKYGMPLYKSYEVGTIRDGKVNYYKSIPDNMKEYSFVIRKIRRPKGSPYPFHFVLLPFAKEPVWDPHDPPLLSAGVEYEIAFYIK